MISEACIDRQRLSQGLLQTIRVLGEFKGKQELFRTQSPQVLDTLLQASIIESTESSNRLKGIIAPHDRIAAIVGGKAAPKNRPEQEIAGYRDALNTIHAGHDRMAFSTG